MIILKILDAPLSAVTFPELGEKLTLIGALGFFLWYFMKELKQVRESQEKQRQEYEQKLQTMFERVTEMELKSMEVLNGVSNSNSRLAAAVEELENTLKRTV